MQNQGQKQPKQDEKENAGDDTANRRISPLGMQDRYCFGGKSGM
jgi:hypothetical protein